jgi:hypothetical protein
MMADPEGGELCAFVRDPETLPDYRLYEVVVDSADPAAIASWWAERFGVPVQHGTDSDGSVSWLEGVLGPGSNSCSARSRSRRRPRTGCTGTCRGEVDELVAAGARLLRRPDDDISWHILADPEGNEFCVFPPQ